MSSKTALKTDLILITGDNGKTRVIAPWREGEGDLSPLFKK